MNTVFVTQYPMKRDPATSQLTPVFDVSAAAVFGKLNFLVPGGPVVLSTEHLVRTLRDKLSGFQDGDYLLCLGDPAVISVASAIAASKNGGRYSLLVWDRKARTYLPIDVNLSGRTACHAA